MKFLVVLFLFLVGLVIFAFIYTSQNPSAEFILILLSFLISGAVVIVSVLAATVVRLTKRVSQKVFVGIGLVVPGYVMIMALAGYFYALTTTSAALAKEDVSICEKLGLHRRIATCYERIARKKVDPMLCHPPEYSYTSSSACVTDLLIATKDLTRCYARSQQKSYYADCVRKVFPTIPMPWEAESKTDPATWCRGYQEYPNLFYIPAEQAQAQQLISKINRIQAEQLCARFPEVKAAISIANRDLAGCYNVLTTNPQVSNCVEEIFPEVKEPWLFDARYDGKATDSAIWCRAYREHSELVATEDKLKASQFCLPYPEDPG